MTHQATISSSSEKCLRVPKTESYTLSRICFEMTRQATMPTSKARRDFVLQMNNTLGEWALPNAWQSFHEFFQNFPAFQKINKK
jgi:hypothetical protein